MNSKFRKILIILIIVLVLILAGFLIYNFLIKKTSTTEIESGGNLPSSGDSEPAESQNNQEITPQAEQKIKAISEIPVLSPTLTKDETAVIYYSKTDGTVWQCNFDGTNKANISETVLEDLIDIIWSPEKDKVISVFEDGFGNISKYSYNYETGKATPLSQHIENIAWSPQNNKIAYQYQNNETDENNINTSNPDGSGYSSVLNIRMKDLIIEWPNNSEIFIREKASGLVTSSLYSINIYSKAFAKIISNSCGFSLKWSPDGNKILYSTTNSKGKNIMIVTADKNGLNEKTTEASTLAEKCVWSQDPRIIFCAIPTNIDQANILPDDFYKGTFSGDDEFYKINIETTEKTKILEDYEMQETYDAVDLFLNPEETHLFFINKTNGLLYSIKL